MKERKCFDVAEVTHDTLAAVGKCVCVWGGSLSFQVSMGLRAVRLGEKEEEIMPLPSWAQFALP